MKDFIESYHNRKIIPILSSGDYIAFFEDVIPGFLEEGFPALQKFASECGFSVVVGDFDFEYAFYPKDGVRDLNEWTKVTLPIETGKP